MIFWDKFGTKNSPTYHTKAVMMKLLVHVLLTTLQGENTSSIATTSSQCGTANASSSHLKQVFLRIQGLMLSKYLPEKHFLTLFVLIFNELLTNGLVLQRLLYFNASYILLQISEYIWILLPSVFIGIANFVLRMP